MPARAEFFYRRRAGDAASRSPQARGRGDHGRHLLRDSRAYRAARLRRVHRSDSRAEVRARAHRAHHLGAVPAVCDRAPAFRQGMSAFDAIVIGGGCAGFSAATALADRGARIVVLEARPGLGGRATAFTDPATGERVDNGQHILMGCYAATFEFLDRIGASDRVRWQSGLKVAMIDRQGRESTLALPSLPSPLHFLAGVLAWDALNWSERLSVLKAGSVLTANGHVPTGISVRQWLSQIGQAPRLCELFWEPLALAALNQSIDQAEAASFKRVLQRVFGADPSCAALVMPAVPLDELYAEPSRRWLIARGGGVRVNAPAR